MNSSKMKLVYTELIYCIAQGLMRKKSVCAHRHKCCGLNENAPRPQAHREWHYMKGFGCVAL